MHKLTVIQNTHNVLLFTTRLSVENWRGASEFVKLSLNKTVHKIYLIR